MIHFTIDDRSLSVPKGTTVYHAAKQHGIDLPIFCYQDRMPPFGACRVCLIEVENMAKLQTSCTLEAAEGMRVKTNTQAAVEGREKVLELLLINHPLDCPICDRGGECPLQDQTMKYGPGTSRFVEEKRHFKKPVSLGAVLMLDRERCIVCARCTRFSDLLAGDSALEFKERGYKTEVGTPDNQPVESKFIGNTIEICPVGALTSQVYRFRARPWDNTSTKTTCTLCPVGCSEMLDSRDGEIMRTRSCENSSVNDMWLCDKGWFGYEFIDHPDRLTTPLVRDFGHLRPASWEEAIGRIADNIIKARPHGKLAGFGGNPLTVEENYLFQKLMREGAYVNHVDHRIGSLALSEEEEGLPPGMEISIGECEHLSFAVLLGLDLTEEFPVIWLRLRQAINSGAKVLFFGHYEPEIAKHLTKTTLHQPGKEREILKQYLPQISELAQKGKGALFVGSQYLNTSHRKQLLASLLELRLKTPQLSLNILEGRGNSMGARVAGMHPFGGSAGGLSALQVMEEAANGTWDYIHVAGCNPAEKFSESLWLSARKNVKCLVVQDIFLTETAMCADVVLPTLCFVEKQGSFINIAGKTETIRPGKELPKGLLSDADIFTLIAKRLNIDLALDKKLQGMLQSGHCPPVDWSGFTLKADEVKVQESLPLTAMFSRSLFDEGVRMRHNPHLIKLAKEPMFRLHPLEGIKRGLQNGQAVTVTANGSTIQGKVCLDERVAAQTLVIPLGFPSLKAQNLGMPLMNGISCKIVASAPVRDSTA